MGGPAIMTYNSLLSQIQSYLNNYSDDVTLQLPYFVYQAESRIALETKSLLVENYVVSNFIAGQAVYQKPARWRRNLSLNYGTGTGDNTRTQLYLRSNEYCNAYWPDRTQTAAPVYYSDYGYSNILISPTPDQNYPFEWAFLELPAPLSTANQTNYLTNFCPTLLLYASLLEAVPFLKNFENVPAWESMYARALASINAQDDLRKTDRASQREAD